MMTSNMAFSWTCQPKRNDAYPQSVMAPTKASQVGVNHNFVSAMIWNDKVSAKQVLAVISGRTANEVSPTRPRVTLLMADWSIFSRK